MPRNMTWPLLAALCMLLLAAPADARKAGGPRLVVERTSLTVTEAAPGSTVHQEFVLRNAGDAEVRILKAVSSCGCTVAKYDESIPPGQSGLVILTVTVHPHLAGHRFTQSAVLETDDPRTPSVSLTVNVNVARK